jgi:mRNA degradation ribonuclease J1/J2
MPVHGEYRHLRHHAILAQKLGMDANNVIILETGEVLEVTTDEIKKAGRVPSGAVMVDGLGVGDVGNIVLRDRKHLAEDGILTVVVTIEKEARSVLAGPDIITRGFVYVKESESLIHETRDLVRKELERCLGEGITEWVVIKSSIKNAVGRFLYEKTKRRPLILPIIMEI